MSLPIAETFHSLQGEGQWVGTPMHFIRLAGCPVGAKATQEQVSAAAVTHATIPILSNGLRGSWCKTWDGRPFICDTDFSCHTHKEVSELISETFEHHICLTGGEPLIHQKRLIEQGFFAEAHLKHKMIHVETSGTILLDPRLDHRIWVTVAPKHGVLNPTIDRANELKLLVDENFDDEKILQLVLDHPNVFLCSINEENTINQENLKLAMKWLEKYPHWRLGFQLHKFIGVR